MMVMRASSVSGKRTPVVVLARSSRRALRRGHSRNISGLVLELLAFVALIFASPLAFRLASLLLQPLLLGSRLLLLTGHPGLPLLLAALPELRRKPTRRRRAIVGIITTRRTGATSSSHRETVRTARALGVLPRTANPRVFFLFFPLGEECCVALFWTVGDFNFFTS